MATTTMTSHRICIPGDRLLAFDATRVECGEGVYVVHAAVHASRAGYLHVEEMVSRWRKR